MFEKIKGYYDNGLWDIPRVRGMVIRQILTPEEYESIIGEPIGPWEPDDGTMIGATESADGRKGLVPAPENGSPNRFLNSGGIWTPADGGDADTVDGFHASVENAANTCVVRDANGYTNLGYINPDIPVDDSFLAFNVFVTKRNENILRKTTVYDCIKAVQSVSAVIYAQYGQYFYGFFKLILSPSSTFLLESVRMGGSTLSVYLHIDSNGNLSFEKISSTATKNPRYGNANFSCGKTSDGVYIYVSGTNHTIQSNRIFGFGTREGRFLSFTEYRVSSLPEGSISISA